MSDVSASARRQRLGWDTWGNEALQHVEMPRVIADLPKHATLRANPELRQTIREAYDQLLRARIAQAHYERCRGCGRDTDQVGVTAGCKQCWSRARNTQRRGDPDYRAQQRARQRDHRKSRAKVVK